MHVNLIVEMVNAKASQAHEHAGMPATIAIQCAAEQAWNAVYHATSIVMSAVS